MNIETIVVLAFVAATVAGLTWIEIQSRRHPAPSPESTAFAPAAAPPPETTAEQAARRRKRRR